MASRWKAIISLVLVGHFIAILSAVLAASGPNQSPPALASQLNQAASPYLDSLLLNSSFRFYAPNPGPARLTWYRAERADGTAQWFEMPGFDVLPLRSNYQRGLSLSSFLDMQLGPDSQDPSRLGLSPVGEICVASFARKLILQFDSPENRITAVEIYTVHHRVLEPEQIAAGWSLYDLRLYRPCCLGRFNSHGRSELPSRDHSYPSAEESSRLGARMCRDLASGNRPDDSAELASHWPRPLRELVTDNPELISVAANENDLKGRIERLAHANTNADTEHQTRTVR